jgi:hypothetical protein
MTRRIGLVIAGGDREFVAAAPHIHAGPLELGEPLGAEWAGGGEPETDPGTTARGERALDSSRRVSWCAQRADQGENGL